MKHYTYTFERYEKKYLLTERQCAELLARIEPYVTPDEFGCSRICNLYYDTPDYRLIRRSLDKPFYKEKLRIRCYGMPTPEQTAFVEIKKKTNGIVYKRRTDMTYATATAYMRGEYTPAENQVIREMDWFRSFYQPLAPSMALFYDRIAYVGADSPGLRLTFDRDIHMRAEQPDLCAGTQGSPLLNDDTVLLEIKIPGAMPVWLANLLSALSLFPASFSKYGRAYARLLENEKFIGGVFCA